MLKGIGKIIVSMLITMVIIISTYFCWNKFDNDEGMKIASSYGKLDTSYYYDDFDNVLTSEELVDGTEFNIYLKNVNNYKKTTNLYLKIEDESIINLADLIINVNNETIKINNNKKEEKLYLLKTVALSEYEAMKLNLNINVSSLDNSSLLIYDVMVLDF